MNIITLTAAFMLLTPSVLFSQATTNSPADWTPPGWQVVQMAREGIGASWIDGGIWTNATGRILVWKIQEDSRPLYTESAVLWLQTRTPAGNKWKLAHVFRHPKYPHATWCLHKIMDSPQRDTSTVYNRPPRADEVEAFLRETGWSYMPDRGFRLIDGAVCVQNWQAAMGAPAPQALVNELRRSRSKKGMTELDENGGANRNQPNRSETNRTSSTAGSHR